MTKQHIEYNEDAIQILEGLEAVRRRPGMYIGSTDSRGLHHLVYEIVDNSSENAFFIEKFSGLRRSRILSVSCL